MEYEHAYETQGRFCNKDITFVEFVDDEEAYETSFVDTMQALHELYPDLVFEEVNYFPRSYLIGQHLTTD